MLIFILCVAVLAPYATPESCFQQRCLGCYPEQAGAPRNMVECHPSNWVTAQWVHNLGHPPPSTDSMMAIEYRCLKMVATPDDTSRFGNTVDVIRGCIPRAQVDSVCLALVAVERARGHSNARCSICHGNNCNSAAYAQINTLIGLTSVILYFVLR